MYCTPCADRVLAAERDRLQVLRLQRRDDCAGDVVVRRDRRVDLVVRLDEHLREDRRCVGREPVGHELLRALRQLPALEERVQNGVVAALEPERVLVVWPPQSSATTGFEPYLPFAFSAEMMPLACACPTALPSNEM